MKGHLVFSVVDKEGANEVIKDKVFIERERESAWRICD
jgi:hypothetical protein